MERDRELAREVQARGCRVCEGRLHVANYPRKEYGPAVPGLALAGMRLSFCCGACRKRHTSPSVRFCGRRVYVELVFVLACVAPATEKAVAPADPVAAAPDEEPAPPPQPVAPSSPSPSPPSSPPSVPSPPSSIASVFGVPGRTRTRWRKWWREDFPTSRVWRELQARLVPPVDPASLPGGLLLRLAGTLQERVLRLLELLLPLTVHGPSP